jgi:uncharacterized repeat protein (TIGR01451 family)
MNMASARLAAGIAFIVVVVGTAAWADMPGDIPGTRLPGTIGTRETTAEIAERQAASPEKGERPEHELQYPDRSGLPQNPDALAVARFPEETSQQAAPGELKIHTTAGSFDGATLTDTGAFPPDSMGTVGPAQLIVFVNGRIRSFTKAGVADGVLNADPGVFFASVMTPVGGSVVLNFTSDPQIRYDRFTARWYLSIIDVPCTSASCSATAANRWMVAVSDAASNGIITGSTVWTFFQFQADPGTNFCDYPSLGVDVKALYVGCNIFSSAGAFVGTNGYVVRKTSILGAGPLVVTLFANLAAGAGAGPESPRGVDNFDPAATEGYFVGPDNASFSTITFRRVSNPGSLTPTISANIAVAVPTTTTPNRVAHLGNTAGNNGQLDSLDDRFYQAMIRNGRLWAAHNFRVSPAGVADTTAGTARNASRWYELQSLTSTPTLVQSGTVYDSAGTLAAARQYWIPSVVVTGQGHAVLGMTMAGSPAGATPAYVGRLAGDALGTMTGPPTAAALTFGTTTASYNPPSDPGGASGRRWGDYSFTVVDPLDDMTVWTIQEYNQALNSYAVRIGHLAAPPPATPTCSGSPISFSGPTGNVVITATASGGSGFYDPGANLAPPALPFSHLAATVTNATVNSMTYNSPTQVTLSITAVTAGLQSVTITNPDGQSVTATGCINVTVAGTPDLSLTKSDGGASVAPGGTVAYTLTYANGGTAGATGVVLSETVPANTTFNAGASTAGWVCTPNNNAGSSCTLAIGAVAMGGGSSATFAVTAVNPLPAGVSQISNTASIADDGSHGADPTPANNTASDTTPVTGAQPFTDYYSVQPCRLVDTRVGGSGGPLLSAVPRVFMVTGLCTVPADAVAIAINLAVVTPPADGFVILYPGNGSAPVASTINFHLGGFTLSNNAIVQLASNGAGTLGARSLVGGNGGVDVVIDVLGYFK